VRSKVLSIRRDTAVVATSPAKGVAPIRDVLHQNGAHASVLRCDDVQFQSVPKNALDIRYGHGKKASTESTD
jgi:hypothetical protein